MTNMIVMYNLKPEQNRDEFEQWLESVDIPGYEKTTSMNNPHYYRANGLLGSNDKSPFTYIVTIEISSAEAVENEMNHPDWEDFVADFESRTQDALYITADKIYPK